MPAQKPKPHRHAAKNSAPKVLSSKTVFRGRVFDVTRDRLVEPNGITATREVIRHSGSVVILGIDDSRTETRVLLERQYRYAARDFLLELPAGRVDPGESILAAGKRELLEETGYTAKKWRKILCFYPSPGFLNETMTVFLAQSLRPGIAKPEADEFIEHKLVSLSEALKLIRNGLIRDGKTIAAILWLARFA
jgi:ADP-ribose pyrophosphatase